MSDRSNGSDERRVWDCYERVGYLWWNKLAL